MHLLSSSTLSVYSLSRRQLESDASIIILLHLVLFRADALSHCNLALIEPMFNIVNSLPMWPSCLFFSPIKPKTATNYWTSDWPLFCISKQLQLSFVLLSRVISLRSPKFPRSLPSETILLAKPFFNIFFQMPQTFFQIPLSVPTQPCSACIQHAARLICSSSTLIVWSVGWLICLP